MLNESESESPSYSSLVYDLNERRYSFGDSMLDAEMKHFRAYLRPSTIKINSSLILHPQQFHPLPRSQNIFLMT